MASFYSLLPQQAHAVEVGLGCDFVLGGLEGIVGQGDDSVVARCQRLLQAVVLEARHVALDEGLAGQNLIAPLGEDLGQLPFP